MANYDSRQSLLSSMNDSLNLKETKANPTRIRSHPRSKRPPEKVAEGQEKEHPFINLEPVLVPREFRFEYVLMLLGAYLGIGTLWFFLIEDQISGTKTNGIVDAIYFCVVTMTTVGYGDLVPHSSLAKMLACMYAFIGAALVGLILSNAADYIAEKQGNLLIKALHTNEESNSTEVLMDMETNKVMYKFLTTASLLVVLIIAGIVFLFLVEGMEFVDAIYCVCVTITTLGYGDKSFSTRGGRVFAILWIVSSTVCLAQFFLYLAELYTERRQRALVKWVLTRNLTFQDIEAADMDRDEVVSGSEFILYKLKEMGKISQEDVSMLKERFRALDVDRSGTLTTEDVILS
ncbi:hypothetical protein V6N13_033258 [Hibiscus sabdariffa]|uniref:EF-hand domain-containing protein n=1 Tax=Hibiscus sabdariffa TaxID=183260 RepID=A0ABR2FB32_9ROSI